MPSHSLMKWGFVDYLLALYT